MTKTIYLFLFLNLRFLYMAFDNIGSVVSAKNMFQYVDGEYHIPSHKVIGHLVLEKNILKG